LNKQIKICFASNNLDVKDINIKIDISDISCEKNIECFLNSIDNIFITNDKNLSEKYILSNINYEEFVKMLYVLIYNISYYTNKNCIVKKVIIDNFEFDKNIVINKKTCLAKIKNLYSNIPTFNYAINKFNNYEILENGELCECC